MQDTLYSNYNVDDVFMRSILGGLLELLNNKIIFIYNPPYLAVHPQIDNAIPAIITAIKIKSLTCTYITFFIYKLFTPFFFIKILV